MKRAVERTMSDSMQKRCVCENRASAKKTKSKQIDRATPKETEKKKVGAQHSTLEQTHPNYSEIPKRAERFESEVYI
jgi:hypothetical protein